ncbi:MAG TPA: cytochrome c [Candidatus Polarisedimenticolia bacterium]|nr:cytochrome c [Candidatus Polarisedimenticolia bacterium]
MRSRTPALGPALALAFTISWGAASATDEPWVAPPEARALHSPYPSSSLSRERGAALFAKHCTSCHGAGGRGDGEAAGDLKVRPADLTDPARIGALSAGEIFWKIGHGRNPMPPFGRILPDLDLWHLVDHVLALSGRTVDRVERADLGRRQIFDLPCP